MDHVKVVHCLESMESHTQEETDEERLTHVPSRLDSAQWMWLVEFWGSKEGKVGIKKYLGI